MLDDTQTIEINLVIERPAQPTLLIEIKRSTQVSREMLSSFIRLTREIPDSKAICLSNDPYAKLIEDVTVLPWKRGLIDIFKGLAI